MTERIELDLSRHCIQTAARRQYERQVAACFRSGTDEQGRARLEAEVDLLQRALETIDFGRLRSDWKPLNGGAGLQVYLGEDADGIVVWLDAERIVAPRKKGSVGSLPPTGGPETAP